MSAQLARRLSGHRLRWLVGMALVGLVISGLVFAGGLHAEEGLPGLFDEASESQQDEETVLLVGLGDSLTQGTMDAANNHLNTRHAYHQRVAESLSQVVRLGHRQPLLSLDGDRLQPFKVPTNLGVDGSEVFKAQGLKYGHRYGLDETVEDPEFLADETAQRNFSDNYDRVLSPISLVTGEPASQVDAAEWLVGTAAPNSGVDRTILTLWLGNNDSSAAALGSGAGNPTFIPLPLDLVGPELEPAARLLLRGGQITGQLSTRPYTQENIARNLTTVEDFTDQYTQILSRVRQAAEAGGTPTDIVLITLPYYSAVGYLMDSQDLEYYLQKVDPEYTVPSTFERVAPPDEPITDPFNGDRVSLLTFGMMYTLLSTGHTFDEVNRALEVFGRQRDGLVLSEDERATIRDRIDSFNEAIRSLAEDSADNVHLADVGGYLNDAFAGDETVVVGDRTLSAKWGRGASFSLDGVHPGYTAQALIANRVIEAMNQATGLEAPEHPLDEILASDPYVDDDGDGWVEGPAYEADGMTSILFMFRDPDDSDSGVSPVLPEDIWERISRTLLEEAR